jgi:hypothetical protein
VKMTYTVNRLSKRVDITVVMDGGEPPQPLRVDWGDGTISPLASGTLTANHTYINPGSKWVQVQGNDLRLSEHISVGDTLRAYDPEKFSKTPAELQQVERNKAAQIAGQVKSGSVGTL